MKVAIAKFGGSSIESSAHMVRCAHIINDRPDYKIIVLSATSKTTNQLEKVAVISKESKTKAFNYFLEEIYKRHFLMAQELNIEEAYTQFSKNLNEEVEQLISLIHQEENSLFPQYMDQLYSVGERYSAMMFSSYLKKTNHEAQISYLDARDIIKTDEEYLQANPLIQKIKKRSEILLKTEGLIITSGFIGKTLSGKTTTLGREGSDFSAALFAEALNADYVEIWTDVEGIATLDPRLHKNSRYLENIPYKKAGLLAKAGAKVLFPQTLDPLERNNIPLWIKSSRNIKCVGTLVHDIQENDPVFYGVTSKRFGQESEISIVGHKLDELISENYKEFKSFKIDFTVVKNDSSLLKLLVKSELTAVLTLKIHDCLINK